MLRNSVLYLRISSIKQFYSALYICCSFHAIKQEALLSECSYIYVYVYIYRYIKKKVKVMNWMLSACNSLSKFFTLLSVHARIRKVQSRTLFLINTSFLCSALLFYLFSSPLFFPNSIIFLYHLQGLGFSSKSLFHQKN